MTLEEMMRKSSVQPGNRKGRSPNEGYARGDGLVFKGVADRVAAEPDFREALALATGRSVVSRPRLMNLYLLVRFYLPKLPQGHIIEFGSYRGGSAMFLSKLAQRYLPGTTVFALDTFGGMPKTNKLIDAHNQGDFSNTDIEEIRRAKDEAGLTNLHLVQGLFHETLPGVLRTAPRFSMAHIDCDIYDAVTFAWNAIKGYMVHGGYVVFDDATEASCLGASEAVEDIIHGENLRSEQVYPHFVFRYPPLQG